MIRVGIIANTFDETFGGLAGGHIHFLEVAKRWPDFELTVFAPAIARETIAAELPQARFVAMPSLDGITKLAQLNTLYRSIFALRRLRELRSCDVLLATSHFLPNLVPALFARRGKFIVTVQHLLDPPHKRSGTLLANVISFVFQEIAIALTRKFATAVLVNRPDQAKRIGIKPTDGAVHIMTHGVDHALSDEYECRRDQDVLYLGRLVPTKGIDELLQAWTLVQTQLPIATLTIAGGGNQTYVDNLQELAASLGVTRTVRFLGRVTDHQRLKLLRSHRIFVFPSKEEGWGIAIAEAMANGLPCITYDLEAYRGVFVQGRRSTAVSDVAGLSKMIIDLMTDHIARARLADEASQLGQTFSWNEAARIEHTAIENVLAESENNLNLGQR